MAHVPHPAKISQENEVKITAENRGRVLMPSQGSPRRRQTFEEAKTSTFKQYAEALQRLADS